MSLKLRKVWGAEKKEFLVDADDLLKAINSLKSGECVGFMFGKQGVIICKLDKDYLIKHS